MPGKTGIEVFLLIRQLDKKIPVLILSSYTELCAASLKIGTSDFVRKDGGIDELCARIEAALNRYPGPEITGHPSEKIYQLSPNSCFYPANSTLEIGDQRYPLKTMLAELLTIFCQNQKSFIPGTIICRRLWNNDTASKISLLRDLSLSSGKFWILILRWKSVLPMEKGIVSVLPKNNSKRLIIKISQGTPNLLNLIDLYSWISQ